MTKIKSKISILKVSSKQLQNGDITFEELKAKFKEFQIDSRYKLVVAKKEKIIKVPGFYQMNRICILKTNKKFEDFFEFNRSITKPRNIDRIKDSDFIIKLKKWCLENNIKSQAEYSTFKNTPKEFPNTRTIIKNYGEDYFTKVLGLSRYKETLEDKLLNEEFNNTIKNWCIENDINSINKYRQTKKPKSFPSAERIRQVYGTDYFREIIDVNARSYTYLTLEEARNICIQNGIFTSNFYSKFYQKFNTQSEIKLPSDPYKFYKTNWSNFINLSETQLFIGNSMSNLELFTYKLLYDRNIKFETEKTFEDCRSKNPLPFDFYLPDLFDKPIIIELDGEHHREMDLNNRYYSKNTKKHDEIKNNYCKSNDIKLIRINHIIDIEPTLSKEINFKNLKKVRDLDWTKDFETENEVLESQLSKSIKVKLLLLMAEKNKSQLTNVEIIEKTKVKKSHFYATKNELINLGLINRPNEFNFSQEEFGEIAKLYKNGKTLTEITEITGYKNRTYLIKKLSEMGIEYKSLKSSAEEISLTKSLIAKLYDEGKNQTEISKIINKNQSFVSISIKELKMQRGEIEIDKKVVETAINVRIGIEAGKSMSDLEKELGYTKQYLYKFLKWTKK